jgi:hypothetical protein
VKIAGLDHVFTGAELLFETFEVIAVLIIIVEAIRRDPKDRILLFEISALATFVLGLLLFKLSGFSLIGFIIWLALFFGLTIVAAYFALLGWLRQSKRSN